MKREKQTKQELLYLELHNGSFWSPKELKKLRGGRNQKKKPKRRNLFVK